MIELNSLVPSQEFKNQLTIYTDATFENLKLPNDLQECLKRIGLPLNSYLCVFEENPITFYREPQLRRYALIKGAYLEIAEKTGASTATISRVNRSLNYGNDGYDLVFERLEKKA